jgi:CPA2 family monovalent cation:H+ antiporter-2
MHDFPLLTTIAAAFAAAWILGLVTQRIGLSPIVGYLLAGVVIGPHTPGFVGDVASAHQLAEVGVILLMFGVGLHFHFRDLLAVKSIAVPGAVGQSLVATLVAGLAFLGFGWPLASGLVLGMAMAVASTVVLLRVLEDRAELDTEQGHVAVGWLIVEDIFTVLLLVLVPMIATGANGNGADANGAEGGATASVASIAWAMGKLVALVAIVLLAGSRVVPWVLVQVARLRSRELFTLTVLVLSITVAVVSATLFGASVALGAFLAGMVVGQSPVSHQAASDALPMRDAFAVLFFVSVGMLFDPSFVAEEPLMVAAGLAIVLVVKPITALAIVCLLGHSVRTAMTVAIGLGQIGEFSFILSQVARHHGVFPEEGHHVLVATAVISITLNPLLFRAIPRMERGLRRMPRLWAILNARARRRMRAINAAAGAASEKPLAVIAGYGPVGRVVDALLRDSGLETVVIDLNMDTVRALHERGRRAVFGDASRRDILEQAGVRQAVHLVVTLPQSAAAAPLVLAARELNPSLEIAVRTRYLRERDLLEQAGASAIVIEEGEAGLALARQVMRSRGMDDASSAKLVEGLRRMWSLPE